MRGCEYIITQSSGKTITIRLCDVVFRREEKEVIEHTDPDLLDLAYYVSITFKEQKNETKRETRTQEITGDEILCPCLRWPRIIIRIIRFIKFPTPHTCVCEMDTENTKFITQQDVLYVLRMMCVLWKDELNFSPEDIGTRSIRSAAAMCLFLRNHSVVKIMLLGRWKSDSFLAYIRPQVMEWTTSLSRSMINIEDFRDLETPTEIEARLTPGNRTQNSYCDNHLLIPNLYLENR